jgi:N-acetylneuraminic acid mutarotase
MKLKTSFLCAGLALASLCAASAAETPSLLPYPPMPEAVSSFGATAAGDYIYIFGGHMGRMPGSSLDVLSPHFSRVKISDPKAGWEDLPMQDSSQSPGLVAWDGKVYRVGGLSFRNRSGEETSFRSLDVFSRFDPETKTWTSLPPLPVPRSSLDAAVVDGKLYVVGGWNLQEGSAQAAPWHEEALVYDLGAESGQWTTIAKPPFKTRALAAAAHDHKLYVLGGMKSSNGTTKEVHVYDPKSNEWSAGPELKTAGGFGGFAIAAYDVGGRLCYSGGDGTVYALSANGAEWQPQQRQLFGRMFHRVVPVGDNALAVLGGVAGGNGGYLSSVEVVRLDQAAGQPKVAAWTVEFPGTAKRAQALLMVGGSLYAFGGNSGAKAHDYAKETFQKDAFKFDLANRTVEKLGELPHFTQSGAAFLAGNRIDQSIYVAGGLVPGEEGYVSTDVVQRYRLRSKAWSEEVTHLPASRAMFEAATHDGTTYFFGGSQVKTANPGLVNETWKWKPTDEGSVIPVEGGALPTPRRSFASAVLDGKFYAVGGLDKDNVVVPTVNVYDFAQGTWSEVPGPKRPRVFSRMAAVGGKLYLAGGVSRVEEHLKPEPTIEQFDPKTNEWTVVLEEFGPQVARMALLECQDRLLFYGLDQEKSGVAHFLLIDPSPQTIGYGAAPATNDERGAEGNDLARRLMRMDKNGDGKLTKDEVGPRFQPILASADEDKDGFVTKEEIDAYVRRQGGSAEGPRGPDGPGGAGGAGEGGRGRRGRPGEGRGERPAGAREGANAPATND